MPVWRARDVIRAGTLERLRRALPAIATQHFTLECLAQIAQTVIVRATGPPRIAARIPVLQMKAGAASITVILPAAPVTCPRCAKRYALPVTMVMAAVTMTAVTMISWPSRITFDMGASL